jgi:hypothetical protein
VKDLRFVIIPAAKIVSVEQQEQFGKIASVLIPINGRTVLDILYEQYQNKYDEIIVIGKEKINKIHEYISSKNMKITVIEVDKLVDVGYSILSGINYIKSRYKLTNSDQLAVNLGDTIVQNNNLDIDININKNNIYFTTLKESDRWTTFDYNNGKIKTIFDKIERGYGIFNTFIGAYSFSDINFLYECYSNQDKINTEFVNIDSFYKAILLYNNKYDFMFNETDNWLDIGHMDQYLLSKKEVKARYFNTVEIDKQRGIVTKKSKQKEKFFHEILWYLKLPQKLQYLVPKVFDYSLEYENMYISLEYYGYNTLNELYVYSSLPMNQWDKIFKSIFFTIEDMRKYTVTLGEDEVAASLEEMYIDKTIERLDQIRCDENFQIFFNQKIFINGNEYESIQFYLDKLKDLMIENDMYVGNNFSIIHGDFCFSNILYDSRSNLIRLIDPRGKFGSHDIYGDIRYDLAKLNHSIIGKYDFIINDRFSVEIKENSINYDVHLSLEHNDIDNLFIEYLKEYKYDIKQIHLVTALLFLSMIPLHRDHISRQYAMLATGICLIDQLIKEEKQ